MAVVRLETAAEGMGGDGRMHDQVYDRIAEALIQGQIPPGKSVSLRGLAQTLGVSPMPVREAVRRLIAEKALELQPANKRLRVPGLSEHRLMQLARARQWVEPELAALAAGHASRDVIRRLRDDDAAVMAALTKGDVSAYMQANQDFHFSIYRLAGAELFYDLARTLWLQAGPFMRVVFGRMGTVHLPKDHHQDMIAGLERGDAEGVRASMSADIAEGMDLMMEAVRAHEAEAPVQRRRRK